MDFMRKYLLSLLLLCGLATQSWSAADLCTSAVISQTDASNGSGTMPSWSGSAAPSTLDDAGRAIQGAIAREWNWRNLTVTAGGTADAKTLTYSVVPLAYCTGQQFAFIANTTNTGSATLNVNSLGAKTIKKDVSGTMTALSASDMPAGSRVIVMYDGTDMIWMNSAASVAAQLSNYAALASANVFTAIQTIRSSDAGSGAADIGLLIDRNSASPAAADDLAVISFSGRNGSAATKYYADIIASIVDPTAGSEDGKLSIQTAVAGTEFTNQMHFESGAYMQGATGGAKGSGTLNATEYYKNGVQATRALIATLTTTSGTTQSVTNIPAYRELYIEIAGVSFSASVSMALAVSSDNGSLYGTARPIAVATGSGAGVIYGTIRVSNIQTTDSIVLAHSVTAIATTDTATVTATAMSKNGGGNAVINAIQFSGGTFDAGTIRVYGLL